MAETQIKRKPTRPYAYRMWCENEQPSFRQLAEILRKQGYEIDDSTLNRWANRDPKWAQALLLKETQPVARIIGALQDAEAEANELKPEHFIGVKAQLVARLFTTVKVLPITTVEEWHRALDCCERLEALIHAERGKVVSEGSTGPLNGAGAASLLDRLNPAVNIAPFKKPSGGGH